MRTWVRGGSWLKAPRHHDQDHGLQRELKSRSQRAARTQSKRWAALGGRAADHSQQRAREFSCVWCTLRQWSRRARTGAHSYNGGREQRCLDCCGRRENRRSENVLNSARDRVDALGTSGKLAQSCGERVQICWRST